MEWPVSPARTHMHYELRDVARQAVEEPENANAIRVAADILRWSVSKQNWRRCGDKIEQHVVNAPQNAEDVARRIAQLKSDCLTCLSRILEGPSAGLLRSKRSP